jgi:hypothetical protein
MANFSRRFLSPGGTDTFVAPNTPRQLRAVARGVDVNVGVANLTATGWRLTGVAPKRQGV